MGPGVLSEVLKDLSRFEDPAVLVCGDTYDDAGVYQLTEDIALVQTVDFFTPMVDDPYMFGKIAVANGLSDVYAMGGIPKTALNVVTFPVDCLDVSILGDILKGGADKLKEAEVSLLGGHTVEDDEPKYGVSVTGIVHPKGIWTNEGAAVGDVLILTKPLGTGLITTAIKGELATTEEINEASQSMETLNKLAAEVAHKVGQVHGCTDITGFGFTGHLLEMVGTASISFLIDSKKLNFLQGALEYAKMGLIPKGAENNRRFVNDRVDFKVEEYMEMTLVTPETSGGLVLAFNKNQAEDYLKEMQKRNQLAYVIGEIIPERTKKLIIK
nr:selenide, water dikinase SelD [endosymbiont 'TC1' of Trimyema compressum]